MSRLLILFAHPALEKSRVNIELIKAVADLPGITFHDLYEEYPDFNIDVQREQELLSNHDVIVMQHPMYWYSTPALLKQWEDVVLEHGWAYGSTGQALQGKKLLNAITAGGSRQAYQARGKHHATIRQFFLPLEYTAILCHMIYLPPFVVFGTHSMTDTDVMQAALDYRRVIENLRDDTLSIDLTQYYQLLNDEVGQEAPDNE